MGSSAPAFPIPLPSFLPPTMGAAYTAEAQSVYLEIP